MYIYVYIYMYIYIYMYVCMYTYNAGDCVCRHARVDAVDHCPHHRNLRRSGGLRTDDFTQASLTVRPDCQSQASLTVANGSEV